MSPDTLTVAVVVPTSIDLATVLTSLEPRIRLLWEPRLFPPMRHVADFDGAPGFTRSVEDQQRFDDLIAQADALYGIPDQSPAALKLAVTRNPGIRWVHTMAAGGGSQVRAAELSEAELARVAVTTSAGVHAGPLAEFALMGLLAGVKDLPQLRLLQEKRAWPERRPTRELGDLNVVLLGTGGIGRAVAERLRPFGSHVIGVNRRGLAVPGLDKVVRYEDLGPLLERADAVISTLPGTDATWHLLSAAALDRLPHGAIIVNVGRGTVIDEAALAERLADGRISFAALDVFEQEPLSPSSPLWDQENVILSAHSAALSTQEEQRIAELFADNAGRLLDGRKLRNRMDIDNFY